MVFLEQLTFSSKEQQKATGFSAPGLLMGVSCSANLPVRLLRWQNVIIYCRNNNNNAHTHEKKSLFFFWNRNPLTVFFFWFLFFFFISFFFSIRLRVLQGSDIIAAFFFVVVAVVSFSLLPKKRQKNVGHKDRDEEIKKKKRGREKTGHTLFCRPCKKKKSWRSITRQREILVLPQKRTCIHVT